MSNFKRRSKRTRARDRFAVGEKARKPMDLFDVTVDPDFDAIDDAEYELREQLGHERGADPD